MGEDVGENNYENLKYYLAFSEGSEVNYENLRSEQSNFRSTLKPRSQIQKRELLYNL
jgi:hypothetical protein